MNTKRRKELSGVQKSRLCTVKKDDRICMKPVTDMHHCIIPKNKRFKEWVKEQDDWNLQPTCDDCNRWTRDADRMENRMHWLHVMVAFKGLRFIEERLDSAPQKMQLFNEHWISAKSEIKHMRKVARTDTNQKHIVQGLRDVGATVLHTHQRGSGAPDIIVGYRGRNFMFEIKSDENATLTPDEQDFIDAWRGDMMIVYSLEDALMFIGAI